MLIFLKGEQLKANARIQNRMDYNPSITLNVKDESHSSNGALGAREYDFNILFAGFRRGIIINSFQKGQIPDL